ncbi:hypothetical protein IMZ48_27475, partial [Candidatus Bathyarchaeota archaeon]|nr:hypothetical protein [Candidatus Bathyarchaeota archaeon]
MTSESAEATAASLKAENFAVLFAEWFNIESNELKDLMSNGEVQAKASDVMGNMKEVAFREAFSNEDFWDIIGDSTIQGHNQPLFKEGLTLQASDFVVNCHEAVKATTVATRPDEIWKRTCAVIMFYAAVKRGDWNENVHNAI